MRHNNYYVSVTESIDYTSTAQLGVHKHSTLCALLPMTLRVKSDCFQETAAGEKIVVLGSSVLLKSTWFILSGKMSIVVAVFVIRSMGFCSQIPGSLKCFFGRTRIKFHRNCEYKANKVRILKRVEKMDLKICNSNTTFFRWQ